MKRSLLVLTMWLGAVVPGLAAEANPTDPTAPAPSVAYKSLFEGYRPFREESIADWRALNAEVGVAGGHVGIMGGAAAGHGSTELSPAHPNHRQ